jgi:hypothetical protein
MDTTQKSQASILHFLSEKNLEHESLYIANAIIVYDVTLDDVLQLAKREDVYKIVCNEQVDLDFLEQPQRLVNQTEKAVEWYVAYFDDLILSGMCNGSMHLISGKSGSPFQTVNNSS